jgi:FAD/FMN-containing dehydrogenase
LLGIVERLRLTILDLRKMRKVEIDLEKKRVSAQGGCVAADIEKPLEGKFFAPCLTTFIS